MQYIKEQIGLLLVLVFLTGVLFVVFYAILVFEPRELTPEEKPCTHCEKQCKEKFKDIGGGDPESMWLHCSLSCNRKYGEIQCLREK
jgi:hypothetical protein